MKPTDISAPSYFHKVVDCQWACPAHTQVPEYIRLIAAGRYDDAYMVNWRSNVFPGILGRTCDRPCEPACRRGRVEEQPVAICRLKRVAADGKGDISTLLPQVPAGKNGQRIALIGAGPASLTVARDLVPLGYTVEVFDGDARGGGMIRTQIPRFRLPEAVIDEEVGYILGMGVETRFGQRVDSLKALLDRGLRCGVRRHRRSQGSRPRHSRAARGGGQHPHRHRRGSPMSRSATSTVSAGGSSCWAAATPRWTAAAPRGAWAARTSRVVVRSGFDEMKASPWEKEDAMHEGIPILNFLVPRSFTHEGGRLTGVWFEKVAAQHDAKGRRSLQPTGEPDLHMACDDVLIAIGQENAFPWIERDIGIAFNEKGRPVVDQVTLQSTRPEVFFGATRRSVRKTSSGPLPTAMTAAISIDKFCNGEDLRDRPPPTVTLLSQKMGIHEWSYDNAISNDIALQGAAARHCGRAQ